MSRYRIYRPGDGAREYATSSGSPVVTQGTSPKAVPIALGVGCLAFVLLLGAAFLGIVGWGVAHGLGLFEGRTSPTADIGFRVLVLEESGERLPALGSLLHDPEVEVYLNAKCVKVNEHPEWEVLDPSKTDEETKLLSPTMQRLFAAAMRDSAGKKLPWVVMGDGKRGVSRSLPLEKPAFMDLLTKYGGPIEAKAVPTNPGGALNLLNPAHPFHAVGPVHAIGN